MKLRTFFQSRLFEQIGMKMDHDVFKRLSPDIELLRLWFLGIILAFLISLLPVLLMVAEFDYRNNFGIFEIIGSLVFSQMTIGISVIYVYSGVTGLILLGIMSPNWMCRIVGIAGSGVMAGIIASAFKVFVSNLTATSNLTENSYYVVAILVDFVIVVVLSSASFLLTLGYRTPCNS